MNLRAAPASILSEGPPNRNASTRNCAREPSAVVIHQCTISTTKRLRHSGITKGCACWTRSLRAKDAFVFYTSCTLRSRHGSTPDVLAPARRWFGALPSTRSVTEAPHMSDGDGDLLVSLVTQRRRVMPV